jgi:hypothetical protein
MSRKVIKRKHDMFIRDQIIYKKLIHVKFFCNNQCPERNSCLILLNKINNMQTCVKYKCDNDLCKIIRDISQHVRNCKNKHCLFCKGLRSYFNKCKNN